jgi:hypothetical protein
VRRLLTPQRVKTARRAPRLAIGAVTVAILAVIALAASSELPRVSAASSGSSAFLLLAPSVTQQGCALGPAFTFCDQAPGTTGTAVQFNVQAATAVNSVSVSMTEITGEFCGRRFHDFRKHLHRKPGRESAMPNFDCVFAHGCRVAPGADQRHGFGWRYSRIQC